MLPSKTVFIVGAGASKEVGMPLGTELRKTISEKLDLRFDTFSSRLEPSGDHDIYTVLSRKAGPQGNQMLNAYLDACWQIRDGIILSQSIDDYIYSRQDNPFIAECGKVAIARSILRAEKNSQLHFENNNIYNTIKFNQTTETWLHGFYLLLTQKVTKNELSNLFSNVTIISFNYDRCLEHYLVHALVEQYRIQIEDARNLVSKLKIFHPYGMVGNYFGSPHEVVEFGYAGIPKFDEIQNNIKTYTEEVGNTEGLNTIRNAIRDAEVLVFLGNAYHEINMKLLEDDSYITAGLSKRIFATNLGISESDMTVVYGQLLRICGLKNVQPRKYDDFHFADTCSNLFSQFQKSLRQ